jgi:hypothetical protein
MGNLA